MPAESAKTVEITVNGKAREIPEATSVQALLELLETPSTRVAVELNRVILKRERWETTLLRGGEELEIVHFVGGG